jgi:hypothetical protein
MGVGSFTEDGVMNEAWLVARTLGKIFVNDGNIVSDVDMVRDNGDQGNVEVEKQVIIWNFDLVTSFHTRPNAYRHRS